MWTLAALALAAVMPPPLPAPPAASPSVPPPAAAAHPGDEPEPVLARGVTEEAVPFGTFQVVTATQVLPPNAMLIPHGGERYPKVSIRWRPANGRWRIDLIDDGGAITLETRGHGCFSIARYYHYTAAPGEEPLFDAVQAAFANAVEHCPRASVEQRADYRAQLAAAAPDFALAFEEMKRRALQLFRRLERCALLPSKNGGLTPMPRIGEPCETVR
jgi:hypothetical protein